MGEEILWLVTKNQPQRILKDYYEEQQANKLDNLEEINKFPDIHNWQELNYEEIEILTDSL